MALAAKAKGYEYYAITDHGPRLTYMKHLGPREIDAQRAEVREINEELGATFHVLHGVELNMGKDGSLDYDDAVLEGFDWCVASLHSSFKMSRARPDEAVPPRDREPARARGRTPVRTSPRPTRGRRLRRGRRSRRRARSTTSRSRSTRIRTGSTCGTSTSGWAREHGVKFVISTDAHSAGELDNMHFGVAMAQRGWAESENIVNTWPWKRFKAFVAAKR